MYFEKDRAKSTLYRLRNRKLLDSVDKITNAWEAVIRIEGLGAFEGLEQKLNSEIAAYRSESTNKASTAEQRESNRKKLAAHEALMEVFRRWRDERRKQQAADAAASTTRRRPHSTLILSHSSTRFRNPTDQQPRRQNHERVPSSRQLSRLACRPVWAARSIGRRRHESCEASLHKTDQTLQARALSERVSVASIGLRFHSRRF